jgi:hypothetical protein
MWIRVNDEAGATVYVDLDRVARIAFTTNNETKQIGGALLYAIGGSGLVPLGSVTGDATLKKIQEHVGLIRSNDFVV